MSGMSAINSGQQTSASIAAFQNKLFGKIDTGSDGQISPDELAAFGQNLPGADGTNQSSGSSNSNLFNQIDTNSDGSISKDELNAYTQQQAQTRAAMLQAQEDSGVKPKRHHHHHGSSGPSESAQTQSPDPTAIFNTLDTNQDGSVSVTEWAAAFGTNGSANVSASAQTADNSSIDTLLQTLNKLV
jgi:Ca2+-binding EF-hand superfamily protein